MSWISRHRRILRDRVFPAVGLLIVFLGSFYLAVRPWFEPTVGQEFRITGGRAPGPRQRITEILGKEAARSGLSLSVSEVPGSIEALEEVNDERIDFALVQGGLNSRNWSNVRQVASLYVEPLQLVVRHELANEVGKNLRALRGHSINLGEPTSGSNALARSVLEFAGLRAQEGDSAGEYLPKFLNHQQLQEITDGAQLPDAVLTVAALPTPVVRHLVSRWGYRLIALPFGEAFALEELNLELEPSRIDPKRVHAILDKVHLHETYVPAFTYGVEPAVPASDLETFGARVLVVTHQKTPPEAVKRLLSVIFLGKFAQVARPPLESTLLDLPAEFELHPGTVEFQERNKPLILGDAVEFLGNATSFTGAVLGGLFVVWQTVKRWYRRRQEQGFEAYLLKVTEVERQALQYELAAHLDLTALIALQSDLGRIKNEALRRFTSGELEGEGLMSGFLTHTNDARDYLARLILHARTTIEKQARRQGLSPEAAWDLAIGGEEPSEGFDPRGPDLPTEGLVL